MDTVILLIVSLAAALVGSIVKKLYINRSWDMSGSFIYTAVGSLVAAVVLLLWGGFGTASTFTVFLGLLFGAVTALQGVTNMVALQLGPLSYTSVIISFSTLISALSGVMFFGESIGVWQIVGIALMLVSFALANDGKTEGKRANLRWLLLCVVAFVATGAIGIMQKVHQSSTFKAELNAFLIISFAVSTLVSGVLGVILRRRKTRDTSERSSAHLWLLLAMMVISGGCVAVNNKLNLYLSGVIDSAIFFPVVNGGGLVLTTLAALVFFRERLTNGQWLGVGVGIVSVVFLCIG